MWVVKLGGGLDDDPALLSWLDELAALGGGRVVIVPGGGRFAAPLRKAHDHWQLSALTAYNMIILAMAQSAAMMHDLCPRLCLARDEADISRILRRGEVPLWMPLSALRQEIDDLTLPGVTSDSLAAWLGNRLNAERLVLVKEFAVDTGLTLQDCADQGLVDPCLPTFASASACPVDFMHKDDLQILRAELLSGHPQDLQRCGLR